MNICPGKLWIAIFFVIVSIGPAIASEPVHYSIELSLDPPTAGLAVQTEIRFPETMGGTTVEFLLSRKLAIESAEPGVVEVNGEGDSEGFETELRRYRVTLSEDAPRLRLHYRGQIDGRLSDQQEEYTRGFRETDGIIGPEGVFLAGNSLWVPWFNRDLITFSWTGDVPEGWHLISQGNGTSRDENGQAHWESGGRMEEIYIVGGPLMRYRQQAGAIEAQAYLRQQDDGLAARYLSATAQYIEMYRELIGKYPYEKFALVENFWETGYGMPSFTLLGSKVIRFPFILTSSYPHEILHNWWGNSVFVDYESGNWCEGLTAYLADDLIKEQRGQGEAARRDTLKKYRDYVRDGRDFPLREFRSRHSAATEAVGYGKTAIGFHMLRRQVGDESFQQFLATFYRKFRGKRAGFGDVRATLEEVSGQDFERFFHEWVGLPGALDLRVKQVSVQALGDGYIVEGTLEQVQEGAVLHHAVPLVVTTTGEPVRTTVALGDRSTGFRVVTAEVPQLLEVDRAFDTFRLLDSRETAPSIGQIFGQSEILAVLPSKTEEAKKNAYRQLAEGWRSDEHSIEIVLDSEFEQIPTDRAVWFFGRENVAAKRWFGGETMNTPSGVLSGEGRSTVAVLRHPEDPAKAIGWIVVDPQTAMAGMGRKLPHYGKYSYLAFDGDEPTNRMKGEWPNADSPLRIDLRPEKDRVAGPVTPTPRLARRALIELPPIFSQTNLMKHVEMLASADLEGRGLGTEGARQAADYIAEQFLAAGLQPGGDEGGYRQYFEVSEGEDGKSHRVANVVGYLPGGNAEFAGQSVVITAHYDHLGHGWPDAHAENRGEVHPGADDNASGVAVLIELAKQFAVDGSPSRNVVFVAFTGEEAGRLGSRYYATASQPFPSDQILGVINLDTVGRLGDKKISVFGSETSREWPHIFRGVSFVTGITSQSVAAGLAASDQQSFIEVGIPAVQISSGANEDYHRPSDTMDRIDEAGLVKVATFTKESVAYLIEREEPLNSTISESKEDVPGNKPSTAGSRRVSFGTVPDFAFPGPGVRVEDVVTDSPAAEAGIQAGDILIEVAGSEIADLRAFSTLLRTLEPDTTVDSIILRDGERISIKVTVRER